MKKIIFLWIILLSSSFAYATFSIVAFDPENGDLGVAVQSKFPDVRPVVPWAKAGVGAIATQASANTSFGPRGLALLENGTSPEDVIKMLIGSDNDPNHRQMGVVDAKGHSATYTGKECFDWHGGINGENFAVQGNILAGEQVVQNMAKAFQETKGQPLADRLIAALEGGQRGGGDRRGMESAALLVVRKDGGYGGYDDRLIDISVYDNPDPIKELRRCYELHKLTFFRSDPKNLMKITPEIARELQEIMKERGFYQGEINGTYDAATKKALSDFMGWENYDNRIRDDDQIDREVLDDIRKKNH
ncbi:MAG: fimbrial assembly protein FimA [Acidobacteria bacterium]|nr:MAG: fimbrial assembly protein FimA [Acidobacteriota bacterium]